MNIHEYQGKELLRRFGVPTPRGYPCFSSAAAVEAAENLGGRTWAVKAQIHGGGRGKGGGVKIANSIPVVRQYAAGILGMKLVTQQTGPEGRRVKRLLVEEGADISEEYYVGMVLDRRTQHVTLMACTKGGMEIEDFAAATPDKIHMVLIDPDTGLSAADADDIARRIGMPEQALSQARSVMQGVYRAFDECDAALVEIDPLVLTRDRCLVALDARFSFDANALFRHPEIVALRDLDEEDPAELEASRFGLSYVSLEGNIGCLVNGAGLAMATMDAIRLYGGAPANFLDVGGGATTGQVAEAFKLMLKNPRLCAILVNTFGGIVKCDVIAAGIVQAVRQLDLKVPLVVRMKGTNEDIGKTILAESGLALIAASDMAEAAERAVAAAREESCLS